MKSIRRIKKPIADLPTDSTMQSITDSIDSIIDHSDKDSIKQIHIDSTDDRRSEYSRSKSITKDLITTNQNHTSLSPAQKTSKVLHKRIDRLLAMQHNRFRMIDSAVADFEKDIEVNDLQTYVTLLKMQGRMLDSFIGYSKVLREDQDINAGIQVNNFNLGSLSTDELRNLVSILDKSKEVTADVQILDR